MKKLTFTTLAVVLALGVAGCTSTQKGAAGGAVVGALTGQIIGRNTTSTVVGGLIGATVGALIGDSIDRPGYYRCRGRNGGIYESPYRDCRR